VKRFHPMVSFLPFEAIAWLGGLITLALLDPHAGHYSFCVFRQLGIPYCPGCGLGHSISLLLHGDVAGSWEAHPLGIAAATILLSRSCVLLTRSAQRIAFTHRPL